MNHENRAVNLEDGSVLDGDARYREPIPAPDEVARPWNVCTIPGCTHSPACPAKLRAWGWYGQRYICEEPGCPHEHCPPKRRAEDDQQPFGIPYKGPALPQHSVSWDGRPLGPRMRAIQDENVEWHLVPVSDARTRPTRLGGERRSTRHATRSRRR
jgi:hypothetical protein